MLLATIAGIGTVYALLFVAGAAIKRDWLQTGIWGVIGLISAVVLGIMMARRPRSVRDEIAPAPQAG